MTKEQLQQYQAIKKEQTQIRQQLEQIEAQMTAPKGSNLDGMPRGQGGGDAMAGMVAWHLELVEKYRGKLQQLAAAQLAIEEAIESLGPVERKLLRHRYIEGLSWEKVCVAMSYSWRQTHNIHSQALQKLRETG